MLSILALVIVIGGAALRDWRKSALADEMSESVPAANAFPDQSGDLQVVGEWQEYLDSLRLRGTIVIYDPLEDLTYVSNRELAGKGYLPASTFKIVNSIIGLEAGFLEDENTIFPYDGTPRRMKSWEQEMTLRQAFARSCLPCYQDLARRMGPDTIRKYVQLLGYGHMDVNQENHDIFWLTGNSHISPYEQVEFLLRLNEEDLPISDNSYAVLRRIMLNEEGPDWKLFAKTGWTQTDNGYNNGWFVGYLEKYGATPEDVPDVYIFATNLTPMPEFDMKQFAGIRKLVSKKALQDLVAL